MALELFNTGKAKMMKWFTLNEKLNWGLLFIMWCNCYCIMRAEIITPRGLAKRIFSRKYINCLSSDCRLSAPKWNRLRHTQSTWVFLHVYRTHAPYEECRYASTIDGHDWRPIKLFYCEKVLILWNRCALKVPYTL